MKTINLSFNPFPSKLHILPIELQWPNLNTLCLNGSYIGLEMIVELLRKTPKSVNIHFLRSTSIVNILDESSVLSIASLRILFVSVVKQHIILKRGKVRFLMQL